MRHEEEIGDWLTQVQGLADYVKCLEDYAQRQLQSGKPIPGWKLVEGRSTRRFTDQDAAFKAINRITDLDVNLESFSLNAVTDGEDSLGEAVVKISHNGEVYTGTGISTDIIESSIRAYVNGINKITAG